MRNMKNPKLIAIFVLSIVIAAGVLVIPLNSTKNITGNVVSAAEQDNIADTYSGSYDYDYAREYSYYFPYSSGIRQFTETANWNLMAKTISGIYNGVYNISGDASYEKKRLSGEPTWGCLPDSGTNTIQCLDSACKFCTTFHPEDDWGWWCKRDWRILPLNAYTPYNSENLDKGRRYTFVRFKTFRGDAWHISQTQQQASDFCKARQQECMSSMGDVSIQCTGCHISVYETSRGGNDYQCMYDNSFKTEADAIRERNIAMQVETYVGDINVGYWSYDYYRAGNNNWFERPPSDLAQCQNEAYTWENGKWCKNLELNSYNTILMNLGIYYHDNMYYSGFRLPCSDFSLLIEKGLINDPSLNLYGLFDLHHGFYSFDKADQPEIDGKWCRGTLTQNGGIGNHGIDFFVNHRELTQEERDSKIINLAFTQDGLINNPHKSVSTGPAWIYLEEGDRLGCSFFASSTDDITIKNIWLQDENGNVIISAENQVIAPEDSGYIRYQFNNDASLYSEDNLISGKRIKCSAIVAGEEGEEVYIESDYLPVIERNIKDKSKYTPTSAFIISGKDKNGNLDWRHILQSIPAIVWKSSSRDSIWCNKLKTFDENGNEKDLEKCGYPLLIDETDAEKEEERTDGATFGNPPAKPPEPEDAYTTSYDIDEFQEDNPLDYQYKTNDKLWWQGQWKEKGMVVVVDYDNYEAGLLAAQLASYLNAPLIFVGEENRNEWEELLKNKMMVVAGVIDSYLLSDNVVLDYNAGKLVIFNFDAAFFNSQHYIDLFGRGKFSSFENTDESYQFMKELGMDDSKLVVVNPDDTKPENCKSQDFCGLSVLGPYMASADDDKLVTIKTTQSAPSYIEIEKKMIELEDETNKDNPNEVTVKQLEDEIKKMRKQVEDKAKEIHDEMQGLVYSKPIKRFDIVAYDRDIPYRLSGMGVNENYDKYYRDPSGNLNCCEQGSGCCECKVTPRIFGNRIDPESISKGSGEISAGIFGLPKCDKESAASDSGSTITGAITGMAPLADEPIQPFWWSPKIISGRSAFLAGLIKSWRESTWGVESASSTYNNFDYSYKSYIRYGYKFSEEQIEESLNKDYPITRINDQNYCRITSNLIGKLHSEGVDFRTGRFYDPNPIPLEPNENERRIAVAFYYSLMSKMKLGMLSSIANVEQMDYLLQGAKITEVQTIPGAPAVGGTRQVIVDVPQNQLRTIVLGDKVKELLPEVHDKFMWAEDDASERINGNSAREAIVSETKEALLLNKFLMQEVYENAKFIKASYSRSPYGTAFTFKLWEQSTQNIRLVEATEIKYPWIIGDNEFTRSMKGKSPYNYDSVDYAIKMYLIKSREVSLKYIAQSKKAIECIHNFDIKKDIFNTCKEDVDDVLSMSVPNIRVTPSTMRGEEIRKAKLINNLFVTADGNYQISNIVAEFQDAYRNLAAAAVITVATAGLGAVPGLIVNGIFLVDAIKSTSDVCYKALVEGYATNIGGDSPGELADDSGVRAKSINLGPSTVTDAQSCYYAAALGVGPFVAAPIAGIALHGMIEKIKVKFPRTANMLKAADAKFGPSLMAEPAKNSKAFSMRPVLSDPSSRGFDFWMKVCDDPEFRKFLDCCGGIEGALNNPQGLSIYVDKFESYLRGMGINNFVRDGNRLIFSEGNNYIGRVVRKISGIEMYGERGKLVFDPLKELIGGHADGNIITMGFSLLDENAVGKNFPLCHEKVHVESFRGLSQGNTNFLQSYLEPVRVVGHDLTLPTNYRRGLHTSELTAYTTDLANEARSLPKGVSSLSLEESEQIRSAVDNFLINKQGTPANLMRDISNSVRRTMDVWSIDLDKMAGRTITYTVNPDRTAIYLSADQYRYIVLEPADNVFSINIHSFDYRVNFFSNDKVLLTKINDILDGRVDPSTLTLGEVSSRVKPQIDEVMDLAGFGAENIKGISTEAEGVLSVLDSCRNTGKTDIAGLNAKLKSLRTAVASFVKGVRERSPPAIADNAESTNWDSCAPQ